MPLTVQQHRVLTLLRKAGRPLTAYALLARLRPQGFSAPTQVYRALERLLDEGRVHRLETLNAYLASAEDAGDRRGFRAYAICDACGQVHVFADRELCRDLQQWMDGQAFTLRRSTIELHGCCAQCSDHAGQPRRPR